MNSLPESILILENIRSIHNVGAVFRSADGAGFQKIYCCGYTPDPDDRRMQKVSLGAELAVQWERAEDAGNLCRRLKQDGYQICALETSKEAEDVFSATFDQQDKIVLVFGHEVDGITTDTLLETDRTLKIPMNGVKESLNISVAAGIAMYEIFRKKRQ